MCVCVRRVNFISTKKKLLSLREREREREELTASGQWSSLVSSFFWHPIVGFAMLNFKTKKNITFMLDVRE